MRPESGLTIRDRRAICEGCSRRGTWALLASPTGALERYCWRCWPRAHRAQLARDEFTFSQQIAGVYLAPPLQADEPSTRVTALHLTAAWHWALAPGSLLRAFWHLRRLRRMVQRAAT